MNKREIIYKAIYKNSTDSKEYIYIGWSSRALEERRKDHLVQASNNSPTSFHQALKNFGEQNFEWSIIKEGSGGLKKYERKIIAAHQNKPAIVVLNTVHTNLVDNSTIDILENACVDYKYDPTMEAINTGKLKPVKNCNSGEKYHSLNEAAKKTRIPKSKLKKLCETGEAYWGVTYAFLDHKNDHIPYLIKEGNNYNKKEIKNIMNGEKFDSPRKAAERYEVSISSILSHAKGQYGILKDQHILCYLDSNGEPILTERHKKAHERLKQRDQIKFVVWHINDKSTINNEGEIIEEKKVEQFTNLQEMIKKIEKEKKVRLDHIKEVIEGKRAHTKNFRIAKVEGGKVILHNSHISDPKKVIRKVALLDKELKIAEKFDNLTSAAKHYGIEDGQISQVAKGKNKSVKWKNENNEIERLRFAFIKDDGTLDLKDKHRALLEHSGDCYYRVFNSGNFQLNDYPSTAAVARATGVPAKKIKMHFNTTNEPFKIQYFEIQRISIS